jgi:hypothetical protein
MGKTPDKHKGEEKCEKTGRLFNEAVSTAYVRLLQAAESTVVKTGSGAGL